MKLVLDLFNNSSHSDSLLLRTLIASSLIVLSMFTTILVSYNFLGFKGLKKSLVNVLNIWHFLLFLLFLFILSLVLATQVPSNSNLISPTDQNQELLHFIFGSLIGFISSSSYFIMLYFSNYNLDFLSTIFYSFLFSVVVGFVNYLIFVISQSLNLYEN